MSFIVRVYGHRGLSQLVLNMPKQYSSDSVFNLTQPYEWVNTLTASAVVTQSGPQPVGDRTTILRVEVPDGQSIRYEINPPGRNVAASVNSPILSGHDQFEFAQGWQFSIIDASTVA